jgi:hypothetical protein
MQFQMIGSTGMITGSGRVNLPSCRIRCYRVRFGSATRCVPVNPLGRGDGRLGHAGRTCAVRPAGPRRIRSEADFQLRNSFSFSNQFEFKSNLNFNDFYLHNKIQEHFITPRKICNDMNAINIYLFKYITL